MLFSFNVEVEGFGGTQRLTLVFVAIEKKFLEAHPRDLQGELPPGNGFE